MSEVVQKELDRVRAAADFARLSPSSRPAQHGRSSASAYRSRMNQAGPTPSAPQPQKSLYTRIMNAKSKTETAEILMEAGKNKPKELARLPIKYFDLSGVDLSKYAQNVRYLPFQKTDLSGSNLSGAKLHGVDMRKAKLPGTVLAGADASSANLAESNMIGMKANRLSLKNSNANGIIATAAQITNTNVTNTTMLGIQGRDLNLNVHGDNFRISGNAPNLKMSGSVSGVSIGDVGVNPDFKGLTAIDPKSLSGVAAAQPGNQPTIKTGSAMAALTSPRLPSSPRAWAGLVTAPGFV